MSNIDIYIRSTCGERVSFASLDSAQEVRDMHDLLKEVGVFVENNGDTYIIELQAFVDEESGNSGFEFIARTD